MALVWSLIAAERGTEAAQANADRIEEWLTQGEAADARRLAREWMDANPQDESGRSQTIRTTR
jgi:hypothetical protein